MDGETRRIGVGVGHATRDARTVMRLFHERLAALAAPLDPGFGFDQLRMEATHTQRLDPGQADFDAAPPASEALDALIDRLTARLGAEAVLRLQPADSHAPERACRLSPAPATGPQTVDWPDRDPLSPPARPLHLFDPPQPVDTLSEAPDGPPARFVWRRVTHRVTRAEGPERIENEWWRAPRHRPRDYYRVEDAEGRRFWLFRAGAFGDQPPPRWYVHGLFA